MSYKKGERMDSNDIKEEFLEIFYENVERDGSEKLIDWLERSDFFEAPASTKLHSSYEGGLCQHSINVYKRFRKLVENEYGPNWENKISAESVAIIALLHDVCKVNYYTTEMRNVKENGNWVQKAFYKIDDALPYGHGEKSVYIISGFMKLTREEAMAINWHMGGFDARVQGGSYSMSAAYYKYPIAMLFHMADMMATYLDEEVEE